MIVRGELAPGTALVEGDLAQALGLSRTPLREAVKLLAQEGLIELRANRSACVRRLEARDILELFEALAGVERCAAELAARRLTPGGLRRLHELQATIEAEHAAGRREAYYAANRAIHRAIVEAAENGPLAQAHAALSPGPSRRGSSPSGSPTGGRNPSPSTGRSSPPWPTGMPRGRAACWPTTWPTPPTP